MSSYQDIDVRLAVCEDKLDLIMKSFNITKRYHSIVAPGQYVEEVKSLFELYREIKGAGLSLLSKEEANQANALESLEQVKKDPSNGNV